MDPINEAQRRGSILLVIRMGNIDLEAPNTPAMEAPPTGYRQQQGGSPGQIMNMQPIVPPGFNRMIPYGAVHDPNARPPANLPYPTVPNFQAVPLPPPQPGNTAQGRPPGGGYPPNFPPGAAFGGPPNLPPGAIPMPAPGGMRPPVPGYGPSAGPPGLPTARPSQTNPMLQPGSGLPPAPLPSPGQFNPGPNVPSLSGNALPGGPTTNSLPGPLPAPRP